MKMTKDERARTYLTWRDMMRRCYNKDRHDYLRYGGRGTRVCKRWHVFSAFVASMGIRPVGLTLDRIDSSKNYSPRNCKWSSRMEQTINRAVVHKVKVGGEVKCLKHWAYTIGVTPSALQHHMKRHRLTAQQEVEWRLK